MAGIPHPNENPNPTNGRIPAARAKLDHRTGWAWRFILWIGIVISLSMTAVTASLALTVTGSTWRTLTANPTADTSTLSAQQERTGGPAAAASSASSAGPASSAVAVGAAAAAAKAADDGQTVNASMTAVSTAVAAMTLVLSVGTTWFAKKYEEVDRLGQEVERRRQELDTQLHEQRSKLDELVKEQERRQHNFDVGRAKLLKARLALHRWVDSESNVYDRYSIFNELAQHLEGLLVADVPIRRSAFEALTHRLPAEPTDLLTDVRDYVCHCHAMHCPDQHRVDIYCNIFSGPERSHFAETRIGDQEYY